MDGYYFIFLNAVRADHNARLEVTLQRVNTILNALENILRNIQHLLENLKGLFNLIFLVGVGSPTFQQNGMRMNHLPNGASATLPRPASLNHQPVPRPVPSLVADSIEIPTVNNLSEIAGLRDVKSTLHTLVILPKIQPQLFKHNVRISNTILLYGPPGTGKTRIVHGLAAESGAVLHVISAGSLLSSFVGDTEKNMKSLFGYLRAVKKCSIVLIDEIDSLCRKRTANEYDYVRRIKTELMSHLTKMDTFQNTWIIAATNCPWDLDSAILRRFHKRLYVPLPDAEDRLELFQLFTSNIHITCKTEEKLSELNKTCKGFSGSDMATMIQDALDIPLTELHATRIWYKTIDGFYQPATPMDLGNICIAKLEELPMGSIKARSLTLADFIKAAKNFQKTVTPEDIAKYEIFKKGAGQGGRF